MLKTTQMLDGLTQIKATSFLLKRFKEAVLSALMVNAPVLEQPSLDQETAWTFRAANFPAEERCDAWRRATKRLHIPLGTVDEASPLRGNIKCRTSPQGIEFSVVEGAAMEFSGRDTDQADGLWLGVNLLGKANLVDGDRSCEIHPGDLIYCATGVDATLRFPGQFRHLFIRASKAALNPRVSTSASLNLGHLRGSDGIHAVFSGMMQRLADVIMDVTDRELRAVELAVAEFLITSLEVEKVAFGLGGNAGAKAFHFRRVCQDIEDNLADPELSLKTVAAMSGASMRYIQKLFADAGEGFSSYILTRRLERCREELASAHHAGRSISQICFDWGFNGTAHFSRAFKAHYGVTPSEYRRRALSP